MSLALSNFRSAAFGVGASAVLALSSLFPTYAGTVTSKSGLGAKPAVCTEYKNDAAYARCMSTKTRLLEADTAIQDKRAADADRRGAAADKEIQQAQNSTACMEEIGSES